MKTKSLPFCVAMTAAFAGIVACAVSCAKKNSETPTTPTAPAEPATNSTAGSITNTVEATNSPATNATAALTVTNAGETAAVEITNPPPAETTIKAPETTTLAETNVPGHAAMVEMPTNTPAAPANFYPAEVATGSTNAFLKPLSATDAESGSTNFFVRFRAGYEHIHHGDNNDSYNVGAKFYAYGDGLRQAAGKNAWFIPDADAEISSQPIAKPDGDPHPGSDNGLRFRTDFTWPWLRWTSLTFANTNSYCPFCQPLALGLGPTVNVGFDHLYNESDYRFTRYAGLRLTFNRSGFIEYTGGETDGLGGTRQQVVAELPFYESRDGEVRYYLRGLWNHGSSDRPDVYEGGVFLEMPFSTLVRPDKWHDLVPCIQ